ncbi:hypothetical protein OUZ56_030362 [Daphnia magna]|uniref:Uncharacterized protein n=1 Tax=Daphnia magna TaxID=35525 RepID=A0ABQ9ZR30_9CRUS|nr:hypothetical protein OUZ56_030362 [Daphnia magna]
MAACRVAGLHEYCFSQRENGLLSVVAREGFGMELVFELDNLFWKATFGEKHEISVDPQQIRAMMKPLEGQESLFNVGYSDVESNTLRSFCTQETIADFGNFYSVDAKAWVHSFTAVPVAGFCACDLPCGVAHSISTKYWGILEFIVVFMYCLYSMRAFAEVTRTLHTSH